MSDKKNILVFVVDDDFMQLEILKDYLSKNGNYTIKTFLSGEECLQNLSQNPSIIFLDYNLNSVNKKAKDGLTVLKEIRKSSPQIEVVMFSGQEKIEVAVNSMTSGAFDYIVKSESAFVRVENVIKNILKRHKLQEENKFFKKLTISFGVILVLMIVGVIIAYSLGYINDKEVGGDII
ncbi:MAG TPA: response regulator [Cytophagaceae bacterium]|jgi:two-component system OmpR family response regulator|nr:response regulator [Cytophagaceae bacterium]